MAEVGRSQNLDKNKIQNGGPNLADKNPNAAREEVTLLEQPPVESSQTQHRADIPQVEMGRKKVDDMRFMITCTNWMKP
ncbi:hypothetical protein XELAEV_18032870mg [Xenopus laevis]|uniref:Uncharacterized protein n=1 Tax=Xenopus laevis TaxID=8355 RepID=A0A974CJN7_XENLA|nr:hypothetical protein XELAEV_18032870mg [Xenopus laevis]